MHLPNLITSYVSIYKVCLLCIQSFWRMSMCFKTILNINLPSENSTGNELISTEQAQAKLRHRLKQTNKSTFATFSFTKFVLPFFVLLLLEGRQFLLQQFPIVGKIWSSQPLTSGLACHEALQVLNQCLLLRSPHTVLGCADCAMSHPLSQSEINHEQIPVHVFSCLNQWWPCFHRSAACLSFLLNISVIFWNLFHKMPLYDIA